MKIDVKMRSNETCKWNEIFQKLKKKENQQGNQNYYIHSLERVEITWDCNHQYDHATFFFLKKKNEKQ